MNMIKMRLCLMMFLQFFAWGAWFVTLGTFLATDLHADGEQTGMAFAAQSWGAILAPFVIGLIADRYFRAERMLGCMHLLAAALMVAMYNARDFGSFHPAVLAYMVVYMPTLALANAVAFRQLADTAAEFPAIRLWGTVGWIVAGLCISYVFGWDQPAAMASGALRNTFLLAASASLLLGAYSFTLPATPPHAANGGGLGELLGAGALGLLRDRDFTVFFVSAVLVCIPLAFYYQNANLFLTERGVANPAGIMTIGQVSEAACILLLPFCFRRFGLKRTLLVGMIAWSLRYALFAFGDAGAGLWMLLLGIALHGVCYDFFFVAGQVYTDARAGDRIKASAQGLVTLATYGLGMLIGFHVAGRVTDAWRLHAGHDWMPVWLVPSALAGAVFLLFALFFTGKDSLAEGDRP